MKILINAYTCSLGMGNDPSMAWNEVSNLANKYELYI